jgi:S1-C subfamily serine protease
VAEVTPGSPAADAGLTPGDVIVEINREPVRSVEAAAARLRATSSGEAALLLVNRNGREVFMTLTAR